MKANEGSKEIIAISPMRMNPGPTPAVSPMHSSLDDEGSNQTSPDCWNLIGVWGKRDCPELKRHLHCHHCPVFASAAAERLDGEVNEASIREWSEHIAKPKLIEKAASHTRLVFRLGEEWLGLRANMFQEIAEVRPIHKIPHQKDRFILGLVNVRGELLVCVNLAEAIGVDSKPPNIRRSGSSIARLLVVEGEKGRLVFPVDEVMGTQKVLDRDIKAAPATMTKLASSFTLGIMKVRDRSVGLLDEEELMCALNRILE